MPITLSGKTYYRTIEACRMVGISRNTLFRWLREGTFKDVESVDRRGWRLFTEDDISRLTSEANRVRHNDLRPGRESGEAGRQPDVQT